MNRALPYRSIIQFGAPIVLLSILTLLIQHSFVHDNNALGLGFTIDLLFTVPLIYFLLIRKSTIPKTTVVPVMIIGMLLGSYFLPQENQIFLSLFKHWALPLIEVSVLVYIIIKVRKTIKNYKVLKKTTSDFYDTLKKVCYETLPKKVALPFATEIAVFYYGFIHWKKRTINHNEFTYYQKSGIPSLLGGFILIIVIETITVHYLLAEWNPLIAWILTGLSTYSIIQILGFAKAFAQRPIIIEEETLHLRYSILAESNISITNISSIILSKKESKEMKTLSPLGELEGHNVVITLKQEHTLVGLYGSTKKYKTLALHLDEPAAFKEEIENRLSSCL